jgi:hypothetical protein
MCVASVPFPASQQTNKNHWRQMWCCWCHSRLSKGLCQQVWFVHTLHIPKKKKKKKLLFACFLALGIPCVIRVCLLECFGQAREFMLTLWLTMGVSGHLVSAWLLKELKTKVRNAYVIVHQEKQKTVLRKGGRQLSKRWALPRMMFRNLQIT